MDQNATNNTEVEAQVQPTEPTSQDIVSRVSKAVEPAQEVNTDSLESKISSIEDGINQPLLTEEEINSIPDQKLRDYLRNKEKDMVKGMNDKFRQIAEVKKELEQKQQQYQSSDVWTKERLERELQRPEFTQIVQDYASTVAPNDFEGTQDEWSTLSDDDKRRFNIMQEEVRILKDSQRQFQLQKVDQTLKSKYENYNPDDISKFEQQISRGLDDLSRRELIYKARSYDDAVKRAYEMGLQDRNSNLTEKMNATSISSQPSQVVNTDVPKKEEGETASSFFRRIAQKNIQKLRNK